MADAPVITVRLIDGSTREVGAGATAAELANAIGRRLGRDAVAAEVNGELVDLGRVLSAGDTVRIITKDTDDGREVLRHSTSHVLAQAVRRMWPGAHYAIGPAIADGFYYDFELPEDAHFTDDDLPRIEVTMRQIIGEDQPFVREEHSIDEGIWIFADQPFKREIIERVAGRTPDADSAELASEAPIGATSVSIYRNSEEFADLCRGPHVPTTGQLGAFKLTRVAGAYWRGRSDLPQLQRIYGTAWESEAALSAYLVRLEEAEKRDHRRLGAELDLFSFPDEIGSGLPVFHPKGGIIRMVMEEYSRKRHEAAGYDFVYTPHITKGDLFNTSGHLQWYEEGMFPAMELDEGQRYYLKPMNCPFHILIYKSRQRSYRELPLRLFEFGTVYRYEKSGVVHGLTRARGFAQDDAHIFTTREEMRYEIASLLSFVLEVLRDYGLDDFYLELSTKPTEKAVGTDAEWDDATEVLRSVAEEIGLELTVDIGGGAFYGPKISVQARDAIGRTWQISTIQLDFQSAQRFELEYIGSDNARHRPIMIHRALFGSVERFFAVLLEHYAGAFPTWLAPVQVRVLPVRDDDELYGTTVVERLRAAGVRVDEDRASEPLGARIRRGKLERIPYLIVVGPEDGTAGTVGVNARGSERPVRGVPVGEFVAAVRSEIDRRSTTTDAAAG